MKEKTARVVFTVLIALALVAAVFVFLLATVTDYDVAKDASAVIQAAVTVAAIVAGGIFAAYKLELFRDFEPHLTIAHTISHRNIGSSYVHIDVTAMLHNNSRVKVELRRGLFTLQEIAPVLDDEELEDRLEARNLIAENVAFSQWPILDQFSCEWSADALIIEPGQTFQETIEFVISREITTVAIHAFFYNAVYSAGSQNPVGWGATAVYDIIGK